MEKDSIGCSKDTKDKIRQKKNQFNEEEAYYVGYDKALVELAEGYETLQKIMSNYSERQLLALMEGSAKVQVKGKGQGQGEGKGESVKAQSEN